MLMAAVRSVRYRFRARRWNARAQSQSDDAESQALCRLAAATNCARSFIEFGFGAFELNAAGLIRQGFRGLLVDGGAENCADMNAIMRRAGYDVRAVPHWITLGDLTPMTAFAAETGDAPGVLSVDIDGNDYWITERLLHAFQPEILIVEYNASFGLRPISVPYSDDFDRHAWSKTGWYHGASITAFHHLLAPRYDLVENINGLNLIYLRRDKALPAYPALTPEQAYSPHVGRDRAFGNSAAEQFAAVSHLPFVDVTAPEKQIGSAPQP